MKVQNNVNYPSHQNYQNYNVQRRNPSFTAIKKMEFSGLYENVPEEGQRLFNAFMQNEEALAFCKKYDVRIYFHAMKKYVNQVESSIHIFYDNPTIGKMKKFWKALNSSEDRVELKAINYNLEESTAQLAEWIMPSTEGLGNSGILNSRIKLKDEGMQKILDEREAKKAAKLAKKQEKLDAKRKKAEEEQRLNKYVQELIERTK